jgi:hypothetical protein
MREREREGLSYTGRGEEGCGGRRSKKNKEDQQSVATARGSPINAQLITQQQQRQGSLAYFLPPLPGAGGVMGRAPAERRDEHQGQEREQLTINSLRQSLSSLRGLQDLEGAHEGIVHAHHGAGIVELAAVVRCREDRDQLTPSEKLVTVFHNLWGEGSENTLWERVGGLT